MPKSSTRSCGTPGGPRPATPKSGRPSHRCAATWGPASGRLRTWPPNTDCGLASSSLPSPRSREWTRESKRTRSLSRPSRTLAFRFRPSLRHRFPRSPRNAVRAELEEMRRTLDRAQAETEAFVRLRTEELTAKEQSLAGRAAAIASKEELVEARDRAAADRLAGLEKDTARREVLRFLTTVPGVSLDQADVIATAFPDMASLGAADAKALTQCKGVTGALARAIRLEIAPGQVEQEQRATRLREEAQGYIEEGEYRASLDCYDRLLRERPEDVAVWFYRAELLVLLDLPEEALQCYTRIVDVDRGNRQAWYERANLLFGLGP